MPSVAKDEIYALLDDLAADGKAIIMISSELPEVLRMSHRIAVMCAGRITAILDNAEATQEKIMHHATHFGEAEQGSNRGEADQQSNLSAEEQVVMMEAQKMKAAQSGIPLPPTPGLPPPNAEP